MTFSTVDVYTMKKDSVYSSEMSNIRPHHVISLKTMVFNIEIYREIGEGDRTDLVPCSVVRFGICGVDY
jgi:hypothetical protein